MTDYESGLVASPGRHVTAVTDKNGNPMIFTIAPNEGKEPSALYLTYRDESISTGWKQIDLTATLPKPGLRCQSIAVTQFASGQVTIAVAAGPALGVASELFVSGQLSDQPTGSDWQNLQSH